jgi:hypothetical protein
VVVISTVAQGRRSRPDQRSASTRAFPLVRHASPGGAYPLTGGSGSLIAWYTVLTARISQRSSRPAQRVPGMTSNSTRHLCIIIARQTSDLDAIRELLDSGINQLIQGGLYMVFIAVALFSIDWRGGVVLFGSLVPLGFLIRWFQVRSQKAFRETRAYCAPDRAVRDNDRDPRGEGVARYETES